MVNRIAELRKQKHLNQVGLALKLNISQYLVSAYETGRHQPSVETLIEMSKLFNVSVDYIIGNTNIKLPIEQYKEGVLSKEEKELLSTFKQLNINNQHRALGLLLGLKESQE